MQFILVDRILELEPGRKVVAVKNLTLAEEYLAEHFPGFPVLPGVLMLEAMAQAAAWLIRITEDYAHSMVVLQSARALKYGNFVAPGRQLAIDVEITTHGATTTECRGKGTLDGATAVSGRFAMERYNLADREPALAATDRAMIAALRLRYAVLRCGDRTAAALPSRSGVTIA